MEQAALGGTTSAACSMAAWHLSTRERWLCIGAIQPSRSEKSARKTCQLLPFAEHWKARLGQETRWRDHGSRDRLRDGSKRISNAFGLC